MVELNDFIHVFDGNLEKNVCDYLIQVFNTNTNLHQEIDNNKKPKFTYLDLTENHSSSDGLKNLHNHIVNKIIEERNKYYNFIDNRVFPNEHAIEHIKIIKYKEQTDSFDVHTDTHDISTSKRFLGFIWFLNDVDSGGEIVFLDKEITPSAGKLVVFPPNWLFPYKELETKTKPKYIITTYLHYN